MQKRILRYSLSAGIAILIALLSGFEEVLFLHMKHVMIEESLNVFFFLYASIPILSITLIVIFLISGIFRGFKENDIESLIKQMPINRMIIQDNS